MRPRTGLMLRAHMTEQITRNSTQTVSEEQVLQVAALAVPFCDPALERLGDSLYIG